MLDFPTTMGAALQEAVDAAHALLALDSARQYGLITGGPIVDVHRCMACIEHGKELGCVPREGAIYELIRGLTGAAA